MRKERIEKDREDFKKRQEERKKRELEMKEIEAMNKRIAEEKKYHDEIEFLDKIQNAIDDNKHASNPMYDHITSCEQLILFCKKHKNKEEVDQEADNDKVESPKKAFNKELNQALEKGLIKMAPSK